MHRRDLVQSGMVNFPMSAETNTHEGGMFVRLFVMDTNEGIGECCGTATFETFQEVFVGSDITKAAQAAAQLETERDWAFEDLPGYEDYMSPEEASKILTIKYESEIQRMEDAKQDVCMFVDGYPRSHALVANLLMGSTGWSGSNVPGETYFICEYKDLTAEGKNIYDMMQNAYPECKLALMTFLDT